MSTPDAWAPSRTWLRVDASDLDRLKELVATPTELTDHPHAVEVRQGVPVYDWAQLRSATAAVADVGGPSDAGLRALTAELAQALLDGPGIVVLAGAFERSVVDRVTEAFEAMIADQRAAGGPAGDHFAPPGANDRVWNALEKLAVRDPDAFVDYYANDALAIACTAWLGPAYQVTSQVNVVNPGGPAQSPHRDYHLGFMDEAQAGAYPAHVHRLSATLTLQGAVAHCDMPVESGPTCYLPHSQKLESGYLAWHRQEVVDLFEKEHVQLPLATGDAVFFNPAVLHAAGGNRSRDIRRMANLLQVSSAFGRAMESVDRLRISSTIYAALRRRRAEGWTDGALHRVVAAAAEGYAFPTNLDRDPPVDGLAPQTQAGLLRRGLSEDWAQDRLDEALREHAERRRSHDGNA